MSSDKWTQASVAYFGKESQIPEFLRKSSEVNALVKTIQSKILSEIDSQPKDFDGEDRQSIADRNDRIFRHIIDLYHKKPNIKNEDMIKSVTEAIISTFKWRKEFGINKVTWNDVPKELLDMKLIHPYVGSDNRVYFWVKTGNYFKAPSDAMTEFYVKGQLFMAERDYVQIISRYENGTIDARPLVIIDVSNFGISQLDMKTIMAYKYIADHYVRLANETAIVGLSWFLEKTCQLVLKLFPKTMIPNLSIMSKKQFVDYLGSDNVPKGLGGDMDVSQVAIPDEVVGGVELLKGKEFHDKEISAFIKHAEWVKKVTE